MSDFKIFKKMRLKTKKIKLISIIILSIFSSCSNETTPGNADEDTGYKPLTNEPEQEGAGSARARAGARA